MPDPFPPSAPAAPSQPPAPLSRSHFRSWFRILRPRPQATRRIICLPHAGGTAGNFRVWLDALPEEVELVVIQYPGREERLAEPLINDMNTMVQQITAALRLTPHLLQKPYLLFGHSMGAAIAYELTRELEAAQRPLPVNLVVSSLEGPGLIKPSQFHCGSDQALLEEIIRVNPQAGYLRNSAELRKIAIPLLRADYQLIESYRPDLAVGPLTVPISAFVANQDTELSAAEATAWEKATSGKFYLHSFPGDHFYLLQSPATVTAACLALLRVGRDSDEIRPVSN